MDILGNVPGFPGFFVAGVFSGALSTVSGGLNSLTAVALEAVMETGFSGFNLSWQKGIYEYI